MTIYEKQMKKLGLNEIQYSKLTGIPVDILKKLLKNEEVSENMGLNDFFRRNTAKVHDELECNNENTKMESIKIKIEDEENDQEILDWYNNEYDKKKLLELAECKSVDEFAKNYKIIVRGKRASRWFYSCIISKKLHNVSEKVVVEFATQLKDLINGNVSKYRDYTDEDCGEKLKKIKKTDLQLSELRKWHEDFDYKIFMEKHNLTNLDLSKNLNLGFSTVSGITSRFKNYKPSDKMLRQIKNYVENFEEENKMVEVEVIDDEPIIDENEQLELFEDLHTSNENAFNSDDYVRQLIKDTLTEKEKWLITLFGGTI